MNELERTYTRGARNNFVAPDAQIQPYVRRMEVLPPEPQEVILRAPVEPEAAAISETDRAVAFSVETGGLAAIVGVGGVVLAMVGWQVPLFSVAALAVFFGLAAVIWFGAWLFHSMASPDGIGLIGVLLQYRLLRHEQRARLDRIDAMMEREEWHEQ
ncbi:MAG TPA: ACS family MFS transporter [Chloroflexi bacterium]|nr:ACS family MFS transporter [Chloroflexota bacterium]